jgi:thiosulfate/3-mercaptopyruvate sulfurtransferase
VLFCASSVFLRSRSNCLAASFVVGRTFKRSRFFTTTTRIMATTSSDSIRSQIMVPVTDAIALHGSSKQEVKFVDGSWFLANRNGRQEFLDGPRVSGAHFFDIDDIAGESPYLHMMPTPQLFGAAMDAMGISNTDHIIVYGSADCPFVHRAWFQIRNMGHGSDLTHLLDGSLADWKARGGPIEEGGSPSNPVVSSKDLVGALNTPTKYRATEPQNILNMEQVKEIIAQGPEADAILVDVRGPERFRGEVEEPRPGMRLGHMPGAINIFFKDLLNPDNVLQFKSKSELLQIISESGLDIDTDKRIIVHCGSGATACALVASLELCGRDPSRNYVYDASWSEWGGVSDTPIEKDGKPVP